MRAILFVYFLSFGIFLPYFSPFLVEQGFSSAAVGALLSAVMFAKVIGPLLLGWWVDYCGQILPTLRTSALLSALLCLAIGGLMLGHAPLLGWFGLLLAFGLVWQPMLSQLDVLTLRRVGEDSHEYSAIRAWGSIGFIVSSVGLGWALDFWPTGRSLLVLLGISLSLLLLVWLLWRTPEPSVRAIETSNKTPLWPVLLRRPMLSFLTLQFLVNVAHGVYYAFYSVYLGANGYTPGVIGLLWALGVVAEIALFFVLPHFLRRVALSALFFLALALMSLRWLMIGFGVESLAVLLSAQLLHAASFGLTHAVGVTVMHQEFSGSLQARGQAVYSGLSYGGGAALGLLLAGGLWSAVGAAASFAVMAGISLLAFGFWWQSRAMMDRRSPVNLPLAEGV
ncbi:MFS transporter [Halothiobacillus sp. DCM-1]|uniref:MFS transporter n=1 Tax=Halothiobacillus sp. DCM-1 TaxID=3112558 RepID=UPI003243568A